MRKFFQTSVLAAAAALAAVAMPASATTINLSGVNAGVANVQAAPVLQDADVANVNFGVQLDSTVDQAATAANNVASIDVSVDQSSFGLNGSLVNAGAVNMSVAPVFQSASALNAGGALLNSDVDQAATAATNVGSIDVTVTQD